MTEKPKTAGVIGWPVGHTLSPLIHRHWAEREGADAVYLPIPVEPGPDNLRRAVAALRAAGFAGVNITLPHKEDALALADSASPSAQAVGAANMLTFHARKIHAHNSDGAGFASSLDGALPERGPVAALMLGAGGAARAVAFALTRLLEAPGRTVSVAIANRTPARAAELAQRFGMSAVDWANRNAALSGANLLVNTTSLGMKGAGPLDIDLSALRGGSLVVDIVYNPLETPLLEAARKRGLRTLNGLGMLMWQAVPAYEAWLGDKAPVDLDLRGKLEAALAARGRGVTVVGLTGSIGMGKSTVLEMFREEGARVWSADEAVYRLYAKDGGAVAAMRAAFPGAIVEGAVDRGRLSAILLRGSGALAQVEAIVHPLVAADRDAFVRTSAGDGAALVVLDIPLLFEKGYAGGFDAVVVVSAPADVQRARVLARPGMSAEKFAAILAKQIPDAEKRRRADYVVSTDRALEATRRDVEKVLADLRKKFG